jgi:hypothetical protein
MVTHDEEHKHRAFLAAAQLKHAWQFQRRGQRPDDDPVEIDVPVGWHALLNQLFADVEHQIPAAERGGFRWRRMRALQGALEIRFDGVRERMTAAIARARDAAAVTCETCGHSGLRRQVAGTHRVSCDAHFLDRLIQSDVAGEQAARRWWATPHPGLGERSPAEVAQAGPPPDVLLDLALRRAMPATPRPNGAHRQRLQGVWPVLRDHFGERLRSLRLAEFEPGSGPGGTLLAQIAGEIDPTAQAGAATRLARAGFSDLRLRLVTDGDLQAPARANDPWSAMLALEASVTIPRYQPAVPR